MSVVQVPPAVGSSGQFIDSIVITSSTNRQIVVVGSPTSTSAHAPVTSAGLGVVSASSGLIQLTSAIAISSGTVTATAATNPWSSAPGFNVPVVNASSGVIQVLTSGTLIAALTSGTVTATAATNPWSSAPGFNVPIVSASSGVIQVLTSGTLIAALSSGTVTLSSNPTIVSASSGVVQTLDSTSQVYSVYMTITSSAGVQSTSIKASAGAVKGYSIFNTNASARYVKLYNTASTPAVGTDTPVVTLLIPGSTAGAGAVQDLGKGVNFATGIGIAIVTGIEATSTGAISAGDVAANIYYT